MMRLTHREIWLAVGLGIFAVAWAIFAFGVSPALDRVETLNRVIPDKQNELEQIRASADEYVALRAGIENLRKRVASQNRTFELLPFVESLVRECGLSTNRETMKLQTLDLGTDYDQTVVEIKLEKLTLPQLIDFLVKLQSSTKVTTSIRRLYIKKNLTNPSLLDSHLEISSLKLSQS